VSSFNVGDKVRVADGKSAKMQYSANVSTGDEGVVTEISDLHVDATCPIAVDFGYGNGTWYMHGNHLKLVSRKNDSVEHPAHYTSHPSGIECIEITQHMSFTLGNAVKYVWRADLKNDAIEDLKKAKWYIEREIAKREAA